MIRIHVGTLGGLRVEREGKELVNASRPPEPAWPAWPATVRPMTEPGKGSTAPTAPNDCVPAGERVD